MELKNLLAHVVGLGLQFMLQSFNMSKLFSLAIHLSVDLVRIFACFVKILIHSSLDLLKVLDLIR